MSPKSALPGYERLGISPLATMPPLQRFPERSFSERSAGRVERSSGEGTLDFQRRLQCRGGMFSANRVRLCRNAAKLAASQLRVEKLIESVAEQREPQNYCYDAQTRSQNPPLQAVLECV